MRPKSAVTSASAGGEERRAKGRRRPEQVSAGHGVETNRLQGLIGFQSRRTLQIGIGILDHETRLEPRDRADQTS